MNPLFDSDNNTVVFLAIAIGGIVAVVFGSGIVMTLHHFFVKLTKLAVVIAIVIGAWTFLRSDSAPPARSEQVNGSVSRSIVLEESAALPPQSFDPKPIPVNSVAIPGRWWEQ